SRTWVPPSGRASVNVNSAGPVSAAARAGSSSRVSAATRRSTAARSISSSRPKECSTLVRDTPAFASHSLWASWRYRTTCPDLFRRDDVRTYMWLDDTRLTPGQQRVIAQIVSLGPCGVPPRQERCDLRILPIPYPEPALNCRTRAERPAKAVTPAAAARHSGGHAHPGASPA